MIFCLINNYMGQAGSFFSSTTSLTMVFKDGHMNSFKIIILACWKLAKMWLVFKWHFNKIETWIQGIHLCFIWSFFLKYYSFSSSFLQKKTSHTHTHTHTHSSLQRFLNMLANTWKKIRNKPVNLEFHHVADWFRTELQCATTSSSCHFNLVFGKYPLCDCTLDLFIPSFYSMIYLCYM